MKQYVYRSISKTEQTTTLHFIIGGTTIILFIFGMYTITPQ